MSSNLNSINLDTRQIKDWRSIVTLVVFVITSKCGYAWADHVPRG
jgi:hypothetical protein